MKSKILIYEEINQIRKMMGLNENYDMHIDELDYEAFKNDENLEALRNALNSNKLVSVAFVKKDGQVRHMLIRKYLSAYEKSQREKTDAQKNIESNFDLQRVIDMNVYLRELKRLKNENIGNDVELLKKDAAKSAWRSINLKNVLGFLVGGNFIDLRGENDILNRYGQEVYDSLTKSMIDSMNNEMPIENN
jgi:hypothetical protein